MLSSFHKLSFIVIKKKRTLKYQDIICPHEINIHNPQDHLAVTIGIIFPFSLDIQHPNPKAELSPFHPPLRLSL